MLSVILLLLYLKIIVKGVKIDSSSGCYWGDNWCKLYRTDLITLLANSVVWGGNILLPLCEI